ncbi:MAG: DNA starvation/stationary phase protection protein [Yoonia sp.]|uniref:Dps family protein n=1 Tax=Yoonia sp. TaxID=2212373 RepID=UPI0021FFB4D2|nr:DNA starvation/stationary phase protection protein [Rhodobacteraceae bacterium S2214]
MTQALNIVGEETDVPSGVRNQDALAEAISGVLADTYRLTFKTHAYHWNVEGPLFYSVHNLTEGQYENLFGAADELAERIRALGKMAPTQMSAIMDGSVVQDRDGALSAGEMCEDLAGDHARIAHRLHALIKIAGDNNDPVTEDLATERSAFHEKAAWMLRALTKA